jgi:hypothetical protein
MQMKDTNINRAALQIEVALIITFWLKLNPLPEVKMADPTSCDQNVKNSVGSEIRSKRPGA